jgi:hypothetical protein
MAVDEQLRQLAERVPAPPPGDADALFRRGVRRRRVRQGAGTMAVVAVLGIGVLTLVGDPSLPDIADRPPAPAPTEGLDGPEHSTADPDRIGCEPDGCELWRRPLSGLPATAQWVAGDPVVIEDEQLVGLEVDTGAVRWQLPIADELRAREGGPVDLSLGRVMLTGTDELVVLANTQGLQLVTQSGRARWARPLPAEGAHLSWAHVTGRSVVFVHEAPPVLSDAEELDSGEPFPLQVTITVLDATDGQIRWSEQAPRQVFALPTLADQHGLLLVEGDDGTIAALEFDSGEPRYQLPGGEELAPEHIGDVLTLRHLDGTAPDTTRLYDAADGTVRAELAGSARALLDIDDRTIVLLATEAGDGSLEAVAVDPDGSMVWRHPVEPDRAGGCCPTILDLDGGWARIVDGPGTDPLIVDTRDGTVRTDDPLAAASAEATGVQSQIGRHLLLERSTQQDTAGYVLRDHTGRTLHISGQATPDPTARTEREIVLLTNPRELVAVRLP